ncbi:MAG: acetoin utilization protein AcuC [Candidatus Hodarchaeota archaeon]
MTKTALVISDKFAEYNFGEAHPLKPERVLLTWELIKGLGLDKHDDCVLLEPRLATDEELYALHTKEYVDFVKKVENLLDAGHLPYETIVEGLRYNLGPGDNPVFPKMHSGSSIVVGGTIVALEAVYEDNGIDKAFNAAGGLHHGMADLASGFCIYNDPAVAIKNLLKKHEKENLKILYIDVDAHHGDGVQHAFYSNPNVMTISIHETGRTLFPGTGFLADIGEGEGEGYSVNLPLEPYTYDDMYLEIFDDIVPEIVKIFDPDLIVSQNGVDTHCTDPLTHLGLTTGCHQSIFKRIHDLAKKHTHGKLLAVGGGGYNISVVPRSWTMLFAELLDCSNSLPEKIPADILSGLNDGRIEDLIPEELIDPEPCPEIKMRLNSYKFLDNHEMQASVIVNTLKTTILPKIEGKA